MRARITDAETRNAFPTTNEAIIFRSESGMSFLDLSTILLTKSIMNTSSISKKKRNWNKFGANIRAIAVIP